MFKNSNYFLFEQELGYAVNLDSINKEADENWKTKSKRGLGDEEEVRLLESDPNIEWVEEQTPKKRVKRDFVDFEPSIFSKYQQKRDFLEENKDKNKHNIMFNDPMWPKLWYIVSVKFIYFNFLRIKH